jgi:hypothetical protein
LIIPDPFKLASVYSAAIMKSQYLRKCSIIVCVALAQCRSVHKPADTDTIKTKRDTSLTQLHYTVSEAPEWSALFDRRVGRRGTGWIGADGIFAIPVDGKDNERAGGDAENMLIFSDTVIGEIADSSLQAGAAIINNTVAFLKGPMPAEENIRFQWATGDPAKPAALFSPKMAASIPGDYYWLGDGFVNTAKDSLYIFAHRMRNSNKSDEWSFKEIATDLIALSPGARPPFETQRQIETPLHFEEGGFGAGVFVNTKAAKAPAPDGYIYVYGNRKGLIVARVKPGNFERFSEWRFWDGSGWNADMQQVKAVAADVSNELSVTALPDGRYALIFTLGGLSPTVGLRLGRTPYGPFGPAIKVYEAKEMQRKNYITYNAKAHPSLSAPGELLISYNVNAFDFWNELKANPNLYRPRFIRLKLH